MSSSQESPIPSPSKSFWSGFGVSGQLSKSSPVPSESLSFSLSRVTNSTDTDSIFK